MGGRQLAPEAWLPFFEWLEYTAIGTAVRESIWAFPIIEAVHLLGLGLLGGALLRRRSASCWGRDLLGSRSTAMVRHAPSMAPWPGWR